ncbi:hypothetical protein [Microbacterium esteraromaticum]|uniref:hypothetical protein n=1 Tax=Microbacterium esteraromaticum TaxID=57043 RepID=UPI0019D4087E|nr:hypothetical protein [Microbacterium esteraromaticum]MBN7793662.1 hypothetical protein [Microbacterium esteraromaticum]
MGQVKREASAVAQVEQMTTWHPLEWWRIEAGRIGGAFAATGAAAAASFMFAAVLPAESAGELALRWTAAWTDGGVAIVLMVLSLVLSVRSDRARERAGLPKWTGMEDDDQH